MGDVKLMADAVNAVAGSPNRRITYATAREQRDGTHIFEVRFHVGGNMEVDYALMVYPDDGPVRLNRREWETFYDVTEWENLAEVYKTDDVWRALAEHCSNSAATA